MWKCHDSLSVLRTSKYENSLVEGVTVLTLQLVTVKMK